MISLDEEIKKDREGNKANRRRYDHQHHHYSNYKQRQNQYHQKHTQPSKTVLKITNLHYSITKEQLQTICEVYGKVKMCKIQWDKIGRSNEKATVEYFDKADAELAAQQLPKSEIEDQFMEVALTNAERMPARKHEIKKNYGSRYRQFNNNKYQRKK